MNEETQKKIDEALIPVREFISEVLTIDGYLISKEDGVTSEITELTIETPIELEVVVDENGEIMLGSAPPIYHVETSVMPVFHSIRIHALVENNTQYNG